MSYHYRTGTVEEVVAVHRALPEFDRPVTAASLNERLSSHSLVLVATRNDEIVGYKAGYALDDQRFYSWLGGVLPEHRSRGVADALRQRQEEWAEAQGYRQILVKSMNRFPAMLQMLISRGYLVCGYEDGGSPQQSKIVFAKTL